VNYRTDGGFITPNGTWVEACPHSLVALRRHVLRVIGQRWKNIDPDRLTKFSELATEDTERYKGEMSSYNTRQENRMRAEAMKVPPAYGGAGGGPAAMGYPPQGMIPPGMDSSRGGYDQYGAAMPGYYGGMEFQGYGYGPMGYGGNGGVAGGYGMPPPPHSQAGGVDPYGPYGGMTVGGGYSNPGMMPYGGGPHDYGPPPPHPMDPQQHQSSPGVVGPPSHLPSMYGPPYGGPSPPGGSWSGQ